MGKDTGIAWCDHTFNPWWGCEKVSSACKNCYAETFDARFHDPPHWGPGSTRRFFGDKHWNQPRRWNEVAEKTGRRARVFCASMADVFEDRTDLVDARRRLWHLIAETPALDWLLLTKRPENIADMLPPTPDSSLPAFPNVWIGTTVESQEYAVERIPHLLAVPAAVRFLSCEPLLGEVDLGSFLDLDGPEGPGIDWVITGCESGRGARPQDPEWFRTLRDQCATAGVAFFFKQGEPAHQLVPFGPPTKGSRFLPVVSEGPGSWVKGDGIIEQPYLDGEQHVSFPVARRFA